VQLERSTAHVGLPLLFFFIVFYNNNSYQRFYTLYGHTVGMGGKTMEWTALVKAHSPSGAEHMWTQWNAVRPMLAAMNILYYSLFGGDMDDTEWTKIIDRNLLTVEEVRTMKSYKGFKPFLAVNWALEEARAAVKEKSLVDESLKHDLGQGMRDELIISQFQQIAFEFRGHCGGIVNLLKQPVPFPYFHLLSFMLLVQLLLMAYSMACEAGGNPYFNIPVLLITSAVLIGMRSLAVQLSNPFGKDSVDFEIESFMKGALDNSVAFLRDSHRTSARHPAKGIKNPLLVGVGSPARPPPPQGQRRNNRLADEPQDSGYDI
jgi:hypothetical protein